MSIKTLYVAAAAAGLMTAGTVHAQAQSIRLFTFRGNSVYEVIEGSRTAGGFVAQNRGTVCGIPVIGYTDRVQRKEYILTQIAGSGVASAVGLKVNGAVVVNLTNFPLPSLDLRQVSANVNADDVVVFVTQGRNRIEKRVPIGQR